MILLMPHDGDDYYTGDEILPDDAHVLAANKAVKNAYDELDSLDRNQNEVVRAHQHLEHAMEILSKTEVVQ